MKNVVNPWSLYLPGREETAYGYLAVAARPHATAKFRRDSHLQGAINHNESNRSKHRNGFIYYDVVICNYIGRPMAVE